MNQRAILRAQRTTTILFLALALGAAPLAAQSKPAATSGSSTPNFESNQGLRGKKLILKDGSFQIVSKYEVIGNRVRYYSVERGEWEEIPASLVDWPATRKAAAQPNKRAERAAEIAHNVDLAEHPGALDVDAGLGLPPGVLLPSGQGMFALDGRKILKLKQDLAKSKLNKGRFLASVIIPVPVLSKKYTIYLDGKHAATRISDSEPVFYYRSSSNAQPRIQLLRTKVKGKRREIEFLSSFYGEKSTQANEIPLNLQQIYGDTYRLMATEDLAPGEYVLAQIDPGEGLDLYVWDFGVDRSPAKKPAKKK